MFNIKNNYTYNAHKEGCIEYQYLNLKKLYFFPI